METIYQIVAVSPDGNYWTSTCVYKTKKEAQVRLEMFIKDAKNVAYASIKELCLY